MASKKVSVIELTEETRKKIAADLGLTERLEKVPRHITVIGINSADLGHAGSLAPLMVFT